jgi:C4-dicarboxylate-specific signal transduction histidine kinase
MTYDVLFVDDEPDNLIVFEAACAGQFRVLTTSSPEHALELLAENEVIVLLADQRMPKMTGLELLSKARVAFPEVVRMLVTAYADLETAIDAINTGHVRRYLKKPWEHGELLGALSEGVEYYQMRSKLAALERRLLETERVYSLGVITAGLARELSGPMAMVGSHVNRARNLIRSAHDSVPPTGQGAATLRAQLTDAEEELANALGGAGRALDLVRGIEIPTGPCERLNVDVSEVLRLTLRLVQMELRSAGSVEIDVHPVPVVLGSPAQLSQVLLNLVVSTLGTMADVPRDKRRLRIKLVHEEPWVVFEVGSPGLARTSGARTTSYPPPASGETPQDLGLAISRSIVSELGGELDTEASESGSALRLKLPRSHQAA